MKHHFASILWPLGAAALLIAIWHVGVSMNDIPPYVLPSPAAVLTAFTSDVPGFMAAAWVTLRVTLLALALALVTGLGLGIVMAQARFLEKLLWPYVILIQVTPIVAVAPFIIIWVSDPLAVLLILAWMAALMPIVANTLMGLKSTDPDLIALFKLYRASRWDRLRLLLLPSALPNVLTGLRISAGLALIGTVVAELVAGSGGVETGLAYRILEASYRLQLDRMFAAFLVLSAMGVSLYAAVGWVSQRILQSWHPSARLS